MKAIGNVRLKYLAVIVFSIFITFTLLLGFSSKVKARTRTYNLKFELAWHTGHPEYKAYQKFIEMIKKETHGRVTFTLFPASQLVPRAQALDGLKKGVIDMLASSGAYYHGMVPEGDVDWMPFVAAGHRKEFWKFINTGKVHDIIYNAYLEKANAVWLTDVLCGDEGIIGRDHHEYRKISDLKGIKLRAAGGVATRAAKALGASPVTMATAEIYPALQRGTVDALIFPLYGMKDYKFYEIAKTYTRPGVFIWCDDLWINKKTFDSLPKDIQAAFRKVAHEWGEWASTEYWPKYEREVVKWCEKKGVKIITLPPSEVKKARELCKPVWNWYASESPQCKELIELLRNWVNSLESK